MLESKNNIAEEPVAIKKSFCFPFTFDFITNTIKTVPNINQIAAKMAITGKSACFTESEKGIIK